MRTLVYSIHGFDKPFLEAAKGEHLLDYTENTLSLDTVTMASGYDAVALFSSDNASKEVLAELAKLGVRYLTLRSVGYDHVDIEAAKRLGLKVANVPEYSPYSIAEHAVAILLMLNRKLHEAQLLMEIQDFRLDTLVGFDLNGKTVGVIGTGKIGMAFARIMHGFGCRLLACDPEENPKASAYNMSYLDLDSLLPQCDIISLCCPLNDSTRRMLAGAQFAKMKKGSILVNTARGGIICTTSLIKYLENGHLGGACLDVYDKEKGMYFFDHRNTVIKDEAYAKLRTFKNVVMTGHQAFLTNEALKGMADTAVQNLTEWESSGKAENELF